MSNSEVPLGRPFQDRIKSSSAGLATFLLKAFSGLVLGTTFGLMGEEIFSYGNLSFIFVIAAVTLAFLRITRKWKWFSVVLLDLFFVLTGLLLRFYILIAPGA